MRVCVSLPTLLRVLLSPVRPPLHLPLLVGVSKIVGSSSSKTFGSAFCKENFSFKTLALRPPSPHEKLFALCLLSQSHPTFLAAQAKTFYSRIFYYRMRINLEAGNRKKQEIKFLSINGSYCFLTADAARPAQQSRALHPVLMAQ